MICLIKAPGPWIVWKETQNGHFNREASSVNSDILAGGGATKIGTTPSLSSSTNVGATSIKSAAYLAWRSSNVGVAGPSTLSSSKSSQVKSVRARAFRKRKRI